MQIYKILLAEFATHRLDGGTNIRYIQAWLGHSDIETTLMYTNVTNHSLSKIQSLLDKLTNGRRNSIFLGRDFGKPESLD